MTATPPVAYAFTTNGVLGSTDGINYRVSINATANVSAFGNCIIISANSIKIGNSTVFSTLNSISFSGSVSNGFFTSSLEVDTGTVNDPNRGIVVKSSDNHWVEIFPSLTTAAYNNQVANNDSAIIFNSPGFTLGQWGSGPAAIRMTANNVAITGNIFSVSANLSFTGTNMTLDGSGNLNAAGNINGNGVVSTSQYFTASGASACLQLYDRSTGLTNAWQWVVTGTQLQAYSVHTTSLLFQLDDSGNLTANNQISAGSQLNIKGHAFATKSLGSANYTIMYDGDDNAALFLGGGTDKQNYYRNTGHAFQSIGGTTTFFQLNSTNALFNTALNSNSATGGIGYSTGAGGTITQGTSRTTGVTINKVSGQITMFTAAGSATAATFTVTNSTVAATDTISLSQKSGTNLYNFLVTAVAAGSFNITFYTTGGTASDAPVINFNVIKGINA